MSYIVSTSVVAHVLDVDERTIRNWSDREGLPKVKRGKWDLVEVVKWWKDNKILADNDVGTEQGKKYKDRYWLAMAEEKELRVSLTKGELIEKESVEHEWATRAADAKKNFLLLALRLAAVLPGKPPEEVMSIVKDEVRQILQAFCRNTKQCPLPEGILDE